MATSDQDLLVETVDDIVSGHEPFVLTGERSWDEKLWAALAGAGLTGVGLDEDAGGSGGELADAVAVVGQLARGAAAVPVAEQLLVAGWAVLAAGLPLPPVEEPLTFTPNGGISAAARPSGGYTLTGTTAEVPWASVAAQIAVVAAGPDGPLLAVVPAVQTMLRTTPNLAGEPRSELTVDQLEVDAGACQPLSVPQAEELRARYALARAVQLSAALQQTLAWTVRYAGEREQFGRPLGRFQAIQMELAQMAGEVTAAAAAVDAAVQALDRGADSTLAVAAAKIRAGSAVEVVARLAHQVHGAIGFTQEHRLHLLTRRLWAWRDEAGSERAWAGVLGAGVLRDGADELWPALCRIL